MNPIQRLTRAGVVRPPHWLPDGVAYLALMGSVAYGVSDDASDRDVYGFCFPPKELVFPHLAGEIPGFGRPAKRFEHWQEHHVADPDGRTTWDFTVYSIVRFFHLAAENNPNMVDALFTPERCVLARTAVSDMVRERRALFLSKRAWQTFKGYAYQQLHKLETKDPKGKRRETVERFGYDVKYAYHLVRLLDEVEQILTTGDLDLTRAREQMKAVRRGEVPLAEVRALFFEKERSLEAAYRDSALPHEPPEDEIKRLLVDCLEHHYGSLDRALVVESRLERFARDVRAALDRLDE